MGKPPQNLVWMDLEMTGLDPDVDRILEIATIVTDSKLIILGEGPVLAIKQSDALIASMDEWNTEHHTDSGLIARTRSEGVTELEAEQATIEFLSKYVDPGKSPLCGNSIAQDRRFLVRYMATLEDYLHYRNLDVSTVKELAVRWRPDIAAGVKKKGMHRAYDDIRDSIEELEYYREHFFNTGESR
ncbi:MAG: oligoribonuclease [Gammaproteobacteria bacterium]|nr:oligoribonuclease [Gammaproteobacteria bacterium]|tara:strand:- start:1006 stop:1563 length:558 start_codon:yes stop_codon:yes gene_type:complete